MKDRLQKEAMIRRKNKQTPVWDFSTSKDETLRPAYEKFLRPHSAASASNSKATKTPPAARPNSGASYASMARPQSGESYASYQSTAPGNPNEAPLNMRYRPSCVQRLSNRVLNPLLFLSWTTASLAQAQALPDLRIPSTAKLFLV